MENNIPTLIKQIYLDRNSIYDHRWFSCHPDTMVDLKLVTRQYNVTNHQHHDGPMESLQTHISYDDLFKVQGSDEVVKNIVVQGKAGMGKSFLCTVLVRGWAKGQLFQQFDFLLFIPLHVDEISIANSLLELLKYYYNKDMCSSVVDYLKMKEEKVLIIVDSWDQLSKPEHKISYFASFLRDELPSVSVIVTCRPSTSLSLITRFKHVDHLVEVCGFNKEAITLYAQSKLVSGPGISAVKLVEEFKRNPLLESECCCPIIYATVCHMLHNRNEALPNTITGIYTKLILYVAFHDIPEKNEIEDDLILSNLAISLPERRQLSWSLLCDVAFHKFRNIHFEMKDYKEIALFKGLLKQAGDSTGVHFNYPNITEYLATFHIMKQPPDKQLEIIKSCSKLKQSTMIWRFFFGLCCTEANTAVENNFIKQAIDGVSQQHYSFNNWHSLCHYAFEAKSEMVSESIVRVLRRFRRSTPHTNTVDFGKPVTAHDCVAVVYVIDNMKKNSSVEINFRECGLKPEQVSDLADALARKDARFQVITMDLSHNQLTDDVVTDLFKRGANSLMFLNKLYLRDCNIKSDGCISAIMCTLMKSVTQKMSQLDLSLNSISVSGLKVLQDAIHSDTFINLEILFMQGSLPEITENIHCLLEFSDMLSAKCNHLRRLDLSAINLGTPGDPIVSQVISKLMAARKNFDLCLNKEYMPEVDQHFIAIMEDSVKKKGEVNHTVVHGVFVGPGRSGKNSVMYRLLGNPPLPHNSHSPSTGVMENVFKAEVKKMCSVTTAVKNLIWRELSFDQESLELMMTTARTYSCQNQRTILSLCDNESECLTTSPDGSQSTISSDCIKYSLKMVKCVSNDANEDNSMIETSQNMTFYTSDIGPMDLFKKAVKLRRMDALREHLESSWTLYLTNTGGQHEFQELLPLLVSGPSVFFVVFPLNADLTKPYEVQFRYPDGREETRYPSPSTLMDEILQILATIFTLELHSYDLKPIIFFIGTHKDMLSECSATNDIRKIDEILQAYVRKTALYHQGSIEFAQSEDSKHPKQLIFTVNNLAQGDEDFEKIRSALQQTVERSHSFNIQCQPSWLIFSLVLRANHKDSQVMKYEDCFTVALSCGISDREQMNKALLFLHYRLGVVRFYNTKELSNLVVIDPQILFDKISNLLLRTFIPEHAHQNEIEEFKLRGTFSVSTLKRIIKKCDSNSKVPLDWLLKLLDHLRIVAYIRDSNGDKYFMPSAILFRAPTNEEPLELSSCKAPPLLIAFFGGFCPRGVPGALIKYLVTNEMKSKLQWELHTDKLFRNQITFGIESCGDIILNILPTHIEILFDPESDEAKLKPTCREAHAQIKQGMDEVFKPKEYYLGFYCSHEKCKSHPQPHPAEINWKSNELKCAESRRRTTLSDAHYVWKIQREEAVTEAVEKVMEFEIDDMHFGQIADSMTEWEGRIAEALNLTEPTVNAIKSKHPQRLELQKREALKKWKERLGSAATYGRLINLFQHAGYANCAHFVNHMCEELSLSLKLPPVADSNNSNQLLLLPAQQPQIPLLPLSSPSPPMQNELLILSENAIVAEMVTEDVLKSPHVTILPMPSLPSGDDKVPDIPRRIYRSEHAIVGIQPNPRNVTRICGATLQEMSEIQEKFQSKWDSDKGACPSIDFVYRIENTYLHRNWVAYKQTLEDQNVEEHYHGTKLACDIDCTSKLCCEDNCGICGISSAGFDRRRIKSNIQFQRFGSGFYLAPNSSKCHFFTQGHSIYRAMLLCDVCPGKKYFVKEDDETLNAPPNGFNCVYGLPGQDLNYEEIVLYNLDAILPKYIIVYQKDGIESLADVIHPSTLSDASDLSQNEIDTAESQVRNSRRSPCLIL